MNRPIRLVRNKLKDRITSVYPALEEIYIPENCRIRIVNYKSEDIKKYDVIFWHRLMRQYYNVKAKYPDAILLFRVGDFYETFGEDAVKTSKILGIVLTNRANGSSKIELAGFPHHSIDTYLPKLVKSGQRVAICEQLEDPKKTKKIVKRGVTELVTPGTSVSDKILDNKQNNYLASVHFGEDEFGVSLLDLSTGEFLIAEGEFEYIENLINSFNPSEIIYSKSKQDEFKKYFAF